MSIELVLLASIGGVVALFLATAFLGAPYVPTHRSQVRRAFQKLRPLTAADHVIDLGVGDGRVLAEARRAGAGIIGGVEINPVLWLDARLRLGAHANVRWGSMWRYRIPTSTTVVYVFGVQRDRKKLVSKIQAWVDAQQRSLDVMTYGNPLDDHTAVRTLGAHYLYRFTPSKSNTLTV